MSASLPPAGDEPEEMEKFSFPPEQRRLVRLILIVVAVAMVFAAVAIVVATR